MRSAKTQVQINMRTRATGKNVSYNGEAPCGICHRDVLNNHKAIQCDHCQKWIHTQCCAIDDNAYKQYTRHVLGLALTAITSTSQIRSSKIVKSRRKTLLTP